MNNHKRSSIKHNVHRPHHHLPSRRFRLGSTASQRARGLEKNEQAPFSPPEDWHEPTDVVPAADGPGEQSYKILVQPAGDGYRHVVTPADIRARLAKLPTKMIEPLEVIQLSRMTKKKQSFPCYGMQWGTTLYLYPMEVSLIEYFGTPPKPAQMTEARMYGGRWVHSSHDDWRLEWTTKSIRDFYLNNILIHELGHLLDNRNRSYTDRERYAEWFAIEHGYRSSVRGDKGAKRRKKPNQVNRRHHGQ